MGYILASASPRRKEILERVGFSFRICATDVDEIINTNLPLEEAVKEIALKKALAIKHFKEDDIIISADTIVVLDGEVFVKPKDKNEAKEILLKLSGKTHQVFTGFALVGKGKQISECVITEVTFHQLSEKDIEEYISTGEPFDKAGAYGIQEKGCLLVKEIRGDYFNVIGLPVSRVNQILKQLFL
jgi:septum formation protein